MTHNLNETKKENIHTKTWKSNSDNRYSLYGSVKVFNGHIWPSERIGKHFDDMVSWVQI